MQLSGDRLVADLLRASLREETEEGGGVLQLRSGPASARTWQTALRTLAVHGLLPFVWETLGARGRLEGLPESGVALLRSASSRAFVENGLRMRSLGAVLGDLRARSIDPLALKGAALVNSVYPSLASRPMGDVDLLVEPEQMPEASSVLEAHGFELSSERPDSLTYRKPPGLAVDLHRRMRIFDGFDRGDLTTQVQPRFLTVDGLRILEPNATLVHLSAHLHGHERETGFILIWLLDLALLVRAWGADLRVDRLRALARSELAWMRILSLASFLRDELGVPLPAALASQAAGIRPVHLDQVLRSRRLALWGLPGLRGWLRLVAHALHLQVKPRPLTPSAGDLLLWIPDRLRAARRG